MDTIQHVHNLFAKYLRRDCSGEELGELLTWLLGMDEGEKNALSAPLQELWNQAKAGKLSSTADQVDWGQVYDRVMQSGDQSRVIPFDRANPRRARWRRLAAAVIFGVLASGGLFLLTRNHSGETAKTGSGILRLPQNIASGGNKAILTLSNGSIIVLDSTKNGMIARQGNERLIKRDSGLAYSPSTAGDVHSGAGAVPFTEISYNTVSIPRAAQYQLILSDGTKVWLNASSSLRFPTAFTGRDRRVELRGEGYFEVARNKAKPFYVQSGGLQVEVLGTHFNVMAYEDEEVIQTTLLEGAVKVSEAGTTEMLEPGKEARLDRASNSLKVVDANVKQAVAWKNGYFYFDRSGVQAIMRQVSRWYDLDIVYEAKPAPDMLFSGEIERNLPLSGIAHLLESGQIHFRIEGKKLIMVK